LVEDCCGNKEPFHDAEALWRLMAQEGKAMKIKRLENKD